MSFGMPNMMLGMLPPGVQQLLDALPTPEQMDSTAKFLRGEITSYNVNGKDGEAVAFFLDQLAQILKQQGLMAAAVEQVEPLKLQCPECKLEFAVDNALAYRRRVEEGYICACANNHEPKVIGSGRLGELTPDELLTFNNDPNVRVIYPPDYYATDEADNTSH